MNRRGATEVRRLVAQGPVSADRLRRRRSSGWVEVVACGYDTAFSSVQEQVVRKLAELKTVFPPAPPGAGEVDHWRCSLRIVDDTDPRGSFAHEVRAGFAQAQSQGWSASDLHLQPLFGARPDRYGRKGLALREAMLSALQSDGPGRGADFVAYVNLNSKVHAAQLASGLNALERSGWDAAIGTRAGEDGGVAHGAGWFGAAKSRAWGRLVQAALPPLSGLLDQNAPLKIFTPRAARAICHLARIDGVTLDCEWLAILAASGLRFGRFPVAWRQRKGSRPPLLAITSMLSDLRLVQGAWRRGALSAPPSPQKERTPL